MHKILGGKTSIILSVIALGVLTLSALTLASAYGESIINNYYGETIVQQAPESLTMAGGKNLGSRQSDIASGFYDLYVENDLTVDGDTILNNTTTPAVNTWSPIREALSYTASTTLNVDTDGTNPIDDIAYYTNTGSDLICNEVWLDPTVASGLLTYSFSVGTTTLTTDGVSWTTTSTGTIIASTTVATTATFVNKTNGNFDNQARPGSYYTKTNSGSASSTLFLLRNGESLVARWKPFNATSSASFTSDGGFNAAGYFNANCWLR